MRRSMRMGLLLTAALVVSTTGCWDKVRVAQKWLFPADAAAAPRELIDPLERNAGIEGMVKPKFWAAEGKDDWDGTWKGYLVAETAENAFLTSGYFEWSRDSLNGGGRYHFKGTFDPETRQICWTGFTITDRQRAANAVYTATLSPDGSTFLDGSWGGGISVPGTWNATSVEGIRN